MKGHKAHHEHHGRHPGEKVNPRHIHHKAHELVHARKRGGKVEGEGVDGAEEDLRDKPEDRTAHDEIGREAEEEHAKRGGKIKKRRRGGKLEHEKKHVGKVEGEEHHCHGGRAPRKARKSGGGCESSPFSSALHGTAATGRTLERETMD